MRGTIWGVVVLMVLSLAVTAAAEEGGGEEAPPSPWASSLGLAYLATSGNSDTTTFGLDFKMERAPTPWGVEIIAVFTRADESSVKTAERYYVGIRGKRALSERLELFAGVRGEKDVFAGIDPRYLVEGGVIFRALVGPKHLLSFDLGATWTDETQVMTLEDGTEVETGIDYLGAVAGLSYEWKISDTASFVERLVYYPNFDNSDDWRITSDTSLTAAVNSWLAVKLGYELRFRNEPIGDNDDTDATTKVSLVARF